MSNPLFVAEVSSNHNHDLERCLEFVRVAANIGCDAVKFQVFHIDQLFAPEALKAKPQLNARRAWELPVSYLPVIKKECEKEHIQLGCTPFDIGSVYDIAPYVDFIKVASYSLLDWNLLRTCANANKQIVISTGGGDDYEIGDAIWVTKRYKPDVTLLHCVSRYPTPVDQCNLAYIDTLRALWGVKVGWSDHSRNAAVIYNAVICHNASMVEFHFDLDGSGEEYTMGHCWLPTEIQPVIEGCRTLNIANGDSHKGTFSLGEQAERLWRADPSDGLRPLKRIREELMNVTD
jgi:sialic acid synthase SpsE